MEEFTKYEVARILGARALQLSMNAPVLLKLSDEDLDSLQRDSLKIAEKEFSENVLPIAVKRPMPEKKETKLKKLKKQVTTAKEDKEIQEKEAEEEKQIKEEGEIMELATPEDEKEEQEKTKEQEI